MKIAIVGAGSAGLFTAWYLTRLAPGIAITLIDKGDPGHGATWKAAGMLAPVHELEFQELSLLQAGIASRELYYQEVGPALGGIGLKQHGSLEVGLTQDDAGWLRRQFEFQKGQGLEVEWLVGGQIQEVEPFVSKGIGHAIWSPRDTQVDHWLLVQRLVEELQQAGVEIWPNRCLQGWNAVPDGGVDLHFEGRPNAHFDQVVLALGIPDAAVQALLPYRIYPVRGEMIALEPLEGMNQQTQVRIVSKVLGNAYVVPKDGRILCGSTSEEKGHDTSNTAGGILNILRKCHAAIPAIYEMNVKGIWSGLRPATLNRLPILFREAGRPILHLNGLYRHGILLGPVLGKSAALMVLGKEALPEVRPFTTPAETSKIP